MYALSFKNSVTPNSSFQKIYIEDPKRLEKLVRKLKKDGRFAVQGRDYARKKGESTPLLVDWYNKKDISVGRYCP